MIDVIAIMKLIWLALCMLIALGATWLIACNAAKNSSYYEDARNLKETSLTASVMTIGLTMLGCWLF